MTVLDFPPHLFPQDRLIYYSKIHSFSFSLLTPTLRVRRIALSPLYYIDEWALDLIFFSAQYYHLCCVPSWPSEKLTFECQKIAKNLTFVFKKIAKKDHLKKNYQWQFFKKRQFFGINIKVNFLTFKCQFSRGSAAPKVDWCASTTSKLRKLWNCGY